MRLDPHWYGSAYGNKSYYSFDHFSIGASYDYHLLFNIGIAFKTFKTTLGEEGDGSEFSQIVVNGTAFDFGAMIIAPVSQLFFNNAKFNFLKKYELKPLLNFSLGYSLTNIGKEIYYIDAFQSDPLPRTARLGYTFEFGLELLYNKEKINAINYSFAIEAEDYLVNQKTQDNIQYQNFIGDINLIKHPVIEYYDANFYINSGYDKNMKGVNLYLKNILF